MTSIASTTGTSNPTRLITSNPPRLVVRMGRLSVSSGSPGPAHTRVAAFLGARCKESACCGHIAPMNSQQLFEAVYQQHANAIKGYAMRRIDPARADDIVAEVFLVAWRRLDDMPAEPRPWLFGVAMRVLANERRRVARQHATIDRLELTVASVDPAESPALANRTVQEALRNLSGTAAEAPRLTPW